MSDSNVNAGGPGCLTLLFVLFVGLKLTGYITWSWWWVCSPMILGGVLFVILLIIVGILLWIEGRGV